MKICIFGSSFNPPHIAHLEIVTALKSLGFDKLLLVPTGNPNHKKIDITTEERVELIEAFAKLCAVDVSYHEIEHDFEYTVESLAYLNFAPSDQVFFTIGGDSVNTLPEWDYFEQLKAMVTFVIVERPGIEIAQSVLGQINYQRLEIATTDISSSSLRRNLNPDLIPQPIYQLICEKNLYLK